MNKNLYVTIRIDVIIHDNENYYYGKDKEQLENSFTLPLTVYNAVNYSDIIREMVKVTIDKYNNPKEDEDE